jgi:hypothetical protein
VRRNKLEEDKLCHPKDDKEEGKNENNPRHSKQDVILKNVLNFWFVMDRAMVSIF